MQNKQSLEVIKLTGVIQNKHIILQKDLRELETSVNPENFVLFDIVKVHNAENELIEHRAYKTMDKSIADYFKRYGFIVTTDFDKSYVIVA